MPEEILYDPNQIATLTYADGDANYKIETCQESLRQIHDRTMEYQASREFSVTRDGIMSSSRTGQTSRSAPDGGDPTSAAPADAIVPPIGEEGEPTGLDDEIRDAINDALGKAREELQKVLADGLQINIDKTEDGFAVTARSLEGNAPTGDEEGEVVILPEADVAVEKKYAVVEPGETEPKHTVTVGMANPATEDGPSTSTFIPSAKADSEAIGLIAVSTAVAINAPLISIQVTA